MFDRFYLLTLIRLAILATVTGLSGLCMSEAQAAPPAAPPAAMFAPVLEGRVNLNTATEDQLQLLPGVGPSTAAKIVAYRQQRRFRAPIHLLRIKGIGRKRFEAMRPYLAVEGDTTLRIAAP